MREISGQPHLLPLSGSADQAEQFGDGAGTKGGHPELAYVSIGRIYALCYFDQADGNGRAYTGCWTERGTCMPHGASDRRTILATCRCSGSHTVDTYK